GRKVRSQLDVTQPESKGTLWWNPGFRINKCLRNRLFSSFLTQFLFFQGIFSIERQIDKGLLQLVGVPLDHQEFVVRQLILEIQARLQSQTAGDKFRSVRDQIADIYGLARQSRLAGKREKLARQLGRAIGKIDD